MTFRGYGSTLRRIPESSPLAAKLAARTQFGAQTVTPDWQIEINRLKRLADRIESGERDSASAAKSLRQRARRIELAVGNAFQREAELRRSRIKGPRRRKTPLTYAVEQSRSGLALCEYRSTGARPFKTPKPVYDALVRIMSKVTAPAKFAQFGETLEQALGEAVPEYLPRSVLRFWIARDLIEHGGARFAPKLKGVAFKRAAVEAWRAAEKAAVEVVPDAE